ncbi:hypothetical protein GCM10027168_19610 [Streptomyces capparidis]
MSTSSTSATSVASAASPPAEETERAGRAAKAAAGEGSGRRGRPGRAAEAQAQPYAAVSRRRVRRRLGVVRGNRYDAAKVTLLVKEHLRLGSELALLGEQAAAHTAQVRGFLDAAWAHLADRRPDALVGGAYLTLADQALIWLLPPPRLHSRCTVVLAELARAEHPAAQEAGRKLREAMAGAGARQDGFGDTDAVRAALRAAVETLHTLCEERTIEDDLQVRRLQHLFVYAGAILALLCVAVPLVAPAELLAGWPQAPAGGRWGTLAAVTGVVVLMGAAGGVLSGLLQTRDARASLLTYRTSMLKLGLRPLVGGLVALVIALLASWGALPAIESVDPGLLLLTAFLAGFSERVFLRLLKVPGEEEDKAREPGGAPRAA